MLAKLFHAGHFNFFSSVYGVNAEAGSVLGFPRMERISSTLESWYVCCLSLPCRIKLFTQPFQNFLLVLKFSCADRALSACLTVGLNMNDCVYIRTASSLKLQLVCLLVRPKFPVSVFINIDTNIIL
jgi:hypothetical protein